jgi:hypothetical protein
MYLHSQNTKVIFAGKELKFCVDSDIERIEVFISKCQPSRKTQQWNWGFVNQTALDSWH